MTFAIAINSWSGIWWSFSRHAIRINKGWISFDYKNIDYAEYIVMQDQVIAELEEAHYGTDAGIE